jgi:hypothetical protein
MPLPRVRTSKTDPLQIASIEVSGGGRHNRTDLMSGQKGRCSPERGLGSRSQDGRCRYSCLGRGSCALARCRTRACFMLSSRMCLAPLPRFAFQPSLIMWRPARIVGDGPGSRTISLGPLETALPPGNYRSGAIGFSASLTRNLRSNAKIHCGQGNCSSRIGTKARTSGGRSCQTTKIGSELGRRRRHRRKALSGSTTTLCA